MAPFALPKPRSALEKRGRCCQQPLGIYTTKYLVRVAVYLWIKRSGFAYFSMSLVSSGMFFAASTIDVRVASGEAIRPALTR
ncbi:hypothetical protein NYA22BAC_02351 [Parasphingorhabdus sp. NYA22]